MKDKELRKAVYKLCAEFYAYSERGIKPQDLNKELGLKSAFDTLREMLE